MAPLVVVGQVARDPVLRIDQPPGAGGGVDVGRRRGDGNLLRWAGDAVILPLLGAATVERVAQLGRADT